MADETEEFEFRARAEREALSSPGKSNAAPQQSTANMIPGQKGPTPIPPVEKPGVMDYIGAPGAALRSMVQNPMADITGRLQAGLENIGGAIVGKNGKHAFDLPAEDKRAEELAESRRYRTDNPVAQKILGKVQDIAESDPVRSLQALPGLPEARMLGELAGPAAKSAGAVIPETAAKVGGAIAPKIAPETAALAQKATDLGIPLRPDMLSQNKLFRLAGEWAEKVPLSGAKDDARQVAFNKGLGELIGADPKAERITHDVFDKAMKQSGETIGAISEKYPVPVTPDFLERLQKSTLKQTPDVAKVVQDYIDDIKTSAKNGAVPGDVFRKLRTELGSQMRSSGNGDLVHALSGLDETMLDAIKTNLTPEELQKFNTARQQYAAAKTIVPLVAKATGGNISPGGLLAQMTKNSVGKENMARGRGGDLGDLAQIGKAFLQEPGSSNTAERGMVGLGLTGGAHFEPHTAAGIYGGANLYNRMGPKIAKKIVQSQKAKDITGVANGP